MCKSFVNLYGWHSKENICERWWICWQKKTVLIKCHLSCINGPVGVHNTNRACFCFLKNLLMRLFVEANKGSDSGVRAFWFSFCHSDTSWQCNGSYEVISVLLSCLSAVWLSGSIIIVLFISVQSGTSYLHLTARLLLRETSH